MDPPSTGTDMNSDIKPTAPLAIIREGDFAPFDIWRRNGAGRLGDPL
jgi:hypothetical protein